MFRNFRPLGDHTRNSALSAAVTLARPEDANFLLIQAETQNVRVTLDGTTPTATVGFLLTAGDPVTVLPVHEDVKAIEVTASAVINYQWAAG